MNTYLGLSTSAPHPHIHTHTHFLHAYSTTVFFFVAIFFLHHIVLTNLQRVFTLLHTYSTNY